MFGLAKDVGKKPSFTWLLFKFLCPFLCWDKPDVRAAESFLFEIIKQLPKGDSGTVGWI